jgi:hypothetical protein
MLHQYGKGRRWNEMLPSTDAYRLDPFALLAPFERAYEEVGMQLDPEGRLIVGNRLLPLSYTRSLSNDERTTSRRDDDLDALLCTSRSTPWEMSVARFCQRVRDVQELLQEDLREIEEPINTLGNSEETLSSEQAMQWEAAKMAYAQAFLECARVVARILSPFTETPEEAVSR